MIRLLLVEDDDRLAASLGDYLANEGFEVCRAGTVAQARRDLEPAIELVILDWRLPDGSGVDLLSEWRKGGVTVPVVMLTARTDLVDRVLGLELGANDYVTKPFEPRELLARIRVRLRERQVAPARAAPEVLRGAGIELRVDTREVRWRDQPVELTRQEFTLLRLLLENPNRVLSREEILNLAWGYESYPTTRTVDTHMLQLRRKFAPELFETVRGIGYRFRISEDLAAK